MRFIVRTMLLNFPSLVTGHAAVKWK